MWVPLTERVDGWGINRVGRGGVQRRFVYPCSPTVATFRLGSEPATAENLFGHLQESLNVPLTANVGTDSAKYMAQGATPMSLFKSRRLRALVTDSPSNMVALRTQAVARGTFFFAFGCAAHAAN